MDDETKVDKVDDKSSIQDNVASCNSAGRSKNPRVEEQVSDAKVEYDDEYNDDSSVEDKGSLVIPNVGSGKSLQEEEQVSSVETEIGDSGSPTVLNMSQAQFMEPPAFVSDTKSYAEYKFDLEVWSRICGLDKRVQAEMVVYRLDGHPSRIKEKVNTQLGSKLKGNEDGIKELIDFLDTIYSKDDMADAWDKFSEFSNFVKASDQSMSEFIAEWENYYHRMKNVECEYSDLILAFKLLQASQLNEIDTKLVLTGVDYKEGKAKKNMLGQVKDSLKKFQGRPVILEDKRSVQVSATLVSDMEDVLISKGWKPPNKQRRRSRSVSPPRTTSQPRSNTNYKGKKNKLGEDRTPMKCFKCKCNHTGNCNCPCVYHFADKCPGVKAPSGAVEVHKKDNQLTSQLGLFVESNILGKTESTYIVEEEDIPRGGSDLVLVMRESLEELVCLTVEKYAALIDCACPSTVSGKRWMEEFYAALRKVDQLKVTVEESPKVYKFGGGEKRKSLGKVIFPCHFAGKNVKITTEVVDADFPLLIGNTMLKRAKAVLYFEERKAIIMGNEVEMIETESGHFSLTVEIPKAECSFVQNDCYFGSVESVTAFINSIQEPLSLKNIQKLHHYFGHIPKKKLQDLIEKANKLTDEVKKHIEHVELHCETCKKNQRAKPRPAVALPRASKFNQVVSLDLKEYPDGKNKYIFYLVDLFSRLTVGSLIPNKKPSTVGAGILKKWIAPMGRMDTIHSDRGGEFCCEELTQVAEYLGVRSTFTAAYSPNQNGVNERNHAICDRMISKMRLEDPTLSAEIALTWALVAKNSLENISGFSPFQIVFGQAPKLPSVYTAGPPGLEEVVMSKSVADHINALHLAREAYISGESDRVIKRALKQRIYRRGQEIQQGDWIYYKNRGKWEGPVKVCTKDGKSLYAVRAGRLLTINSDHADIALFDGEFLGKSEDKQEVTKEPVGESSGSIATTNSGHLELFSKKNDITVEEERVEQDVVPGNTERVEEDREEQVESTGSSNVITAADIRKNDIIRFKRTEESEWEKAKVVGRAGKATGQFRNWWNIQNSDSGHIDHEDMNKVAQIEKVADVTSTEKETQAFVMTIPRYLHNDRRCKEAKEKELSCWDQFDVYREIEDIGQPKIGTNWVLTEKVIDNVVGVKARLTVRGDQEDNIDVRRDSPTVRKGNIKIFCAVAAKENWNIKSIDGTSAFLQGAPIERDVFILPPRERRVPGVLWQLKKPVYGLTDAARGWHLALSTKLIEAGSEKCSVDPAMFLSFSHSSEEKCINGIVVTHVDDLLHGGTYNFENTVMQSVKESFEFSEEESERFRYVGMNMVQDNEGIMINQDHYIQSLDLPDMEAVESLKIDDVLDVEGQADFRGWVAKLLYIGFQSRPDVCFEAKCLSAKFGRATKKDLKSVYKKIQKLKGESTRMFFPNLGDVGNWVLVGYSDAGVKSMPDKVTSVGGQVVMLVNEHKQLACVLNWRSKKLVRKVVSSLAGEALAMVAMVGEIVYNKAILVQIFGVTAQTIPVVIFTDCKNLYDAVHSTSLVEDAWLIPDVAIIQEALEQKTVTSVRRVAGKDMLADCLTKEPLRNY